jgi:hypothetical protein
MEAVDVRELLGKSEAGLNQKTAIGWPQKSA